MPPGGHFASDSDLDSIISLQVDRHKKVRHNSGGGGGGDKYVCSIPGCDETFKRLDHLDRHEYKHTGIKKHACHYDGCIKTYSILTHLKRHIRCTHERLSTNPEKVIPCEVDTCDKLFASLTNMQRHIREVHENPKVYECELCQEKFKQKLKMRRHVISQHTGVYPFNCEKCSKGFYQKWQWEKHEQICKVYICVTCNQQFDKWTLFLKHCKEAKHTRNYYKCEYCESAYVKPSDLKKHVAVKHIQNEDGTIGGQWTCEFENCGRSYAYERNMRKHIATAHKGMTFDCTEDEDCNKAFSSLQNLRKHIKRAHNDEKCDSPAVQKKAKKKTQRKKRKDAGVSKVSNLVKLTGIAVDDDMNKRLRRRDKRALEEVARQLSSTQMEVDSSEQEVAHGPSPPKQIKITASNDANANAIDKKVIQKKLETITESLIQHSTKETQSANVNAIIEQELEYILT